MACVRALRRTDGISAVAVYSNTPMVSWETKACKMLAVLKFVQG